MNHDTADHHHHHCDDADDVVCLCGCHRNIRHGACGAWRACTRLCLTAPRSWSGWTRGRRRRSPSTGATATATWRPRERCTAWVNTNIKINKQTNRKQTQDLTLKNPPPCCVHRKWGQSWTRSETWCAPFRKQEVVCAWRITRPNRRWRWVHESTQWPLKMPRDFDLFEQEIPTRSERSVWFCCTEKFTHFWYWLIDYCVVRLTVQRCRPSGSGWTSCVCVWSNISKTTRPISRWHTRSYKTSCVPLK